MRLRIRGALAQCGARLLDDERGTTMTEFLLTLPIFIVIFLGILNIGMLNAHSVIVDARAYRATWERALPVTKTLLVPPHFSPATGGAMALGEMGNEHARTGIQRAFVTGAEAWTYGRLTTRGTWGESNARAKIADPLFDMEFGLEGRVTESVNPGIIGNSAYVAELFDEQLGFSGGGGGALSALSSVLSTTGTRPAVAAGARYGTVVGSESDTLTLFGRTVSFRAHFNTLVAPYPMGDQNGEAIAVAVTRLTMESHDPYADLLGIGWSQPLPGSSLNVPDLSTGPTNMWVPCNTSIPCQ